MPTDLNHLHEHIEVILKHEEEFLARATDPAKRAAQYLDIAKRAKAAS